MVSEIKRKMKKIKTVEVKILRTLGLLVALSMGLSAQAQVFDWNVNGRQLECCRKLDTRWRST
jgi:hypothetical protein